MRTAKKLKASAKKGRDPGKRLEIHANSLKANNIRDQLHEWPLDVVGSESEEEEDGNSDGALKTVTRLVGSAHDEEPTRLSAADVDKKIKATADECKKSAQTSIEDSLASSSRARNRKKSIPQRRVTVVGTGGMQPEEAAADQPELPAYGQDQEPFAEFSQR